MRRWLWFFLLFGTIVALVAGAGLDVWAGRRVDAEFSRLEERYGSLDGRSLVARPVGIEYNSARYVRAAAALTVRPGPQAGTLLGAVARFEKLPESSVASEHVRAFVDANREAIRLAEEARTRHQSSWDADYAGGIYVPRWMDVRTLSNALYLDALLDDTAGRPDDASRKTAAGLAVAASIRQEPALIAQLIRISTVIQHSEAVERLVARSEPSKAALEELARVLTDNRETDPMRVGLFGELRLVNAALVKLERGEVTDVTSFARSSIWVGPAARIGRPFVRLARRDYLQELERLIELQAGPRPRPSVASPARVKRWDWRRIADTFIPGLERAIDSGDLHNSVLGVTEIGVALRRYRLDRGGYPAELSALVPAYLARLPIDPVTGRPPAYARGGAGFTLKAEAIRKDSSTNAALEWVVAK